MNMKLIRKRFFKLFVIAMEAVTLLLITGVTLAVISEHVYSSAYVFIALLLYHVWRLRNSKIDPEGNITGKV
jgi:heme A synthase